MAWSALPLSDGAAAPRWRAVAAWLAAIAGRQRPQVPLWSPVLLGLGIAGYFAAAGEPAGWLLAALGAALAIALVSMLRAGPLAQVALLLLFLPGLGFEAAALRSRLVAAPILPRPMTANLEGTIVGLDRSASDRPRVLLADVVIFGMEPERTPVRVRVSLDPSTPIDTLTPGMRLTGQARLSPPAGPAEPGGFDFRRFAWFERIGGLGYARTPMLEAEGSDPHAPGLLAFRIRMAASAHIQRLVPGQNGAFASAILTGDRSGIDRSVEAALRVSNLYHIVSISGLHMTLLAAAVFAIIRYGLALVPRLALTWPLKKVAAWAALMAGAAYLFVSGAEVPTQRSYVMTAVVLVAILIDRPALTLRAVALAALVVLLIAPESLVQAGFQMSFAATVALVAAFEALPKLRWWQHLQTAPAWRYVRPVAGVAMTSLVAGLATAPFSAFHFNTMAQYGLLANLLAVPAMGIVVMPVAVVAILLAPLGLDWLPFQVVGLGMGYIIAVARFVAGLDGAIVGIPAGPGISLGLMTLGGLMLVLWIGRGRSVGLAAIGLGAALWAAEPRPDLLIAESGRLFGFRTDAGRVLSSPTGNGFAAASWLENDGDPVDQAAAHARGGLVRRKHRIAAEAPGIGPILYVGTKAAETAAEDCAAASVLIAPNWDAAPDGPCLFVGREQLRREGALAIAVTATGLELRGTRGGPARAWTQ